MSENAENLESVKVENWQEEFKNFNSALEEKILEANHDETKVKWSKLLPELLDEEIFMAGQIAEGQTDAAGNPQMNIVLMQQNGHSLVPFFTSPERLSVIAGPNRSQFDVIKIKVYNFFLTSAGRPAILNPMSAYSRIFTPFEMKILTAEYDEKKEAAKNA